MNLTPPSSMKIGGCPACGRQDCVALSCTNSGSNVDPLTWAVTGVELARLSKVLSALQDVGEKNLTQEQKDIQKETRAKCVALGDVRYRLLRPMWQKNP